MTPPAPAGAHLMTSWGDRFGCAHRRCSCGAATPAPGMESGVTYDGPSGGQVADTLVRSCVEYGQAARLLDQAGRLIASRPVKGARSAWMHPGCITPAARRTRGLALLALLTAATGQAEAPGPAVERDAPGESWPSPAVHPVQPDARLAPGAIELDSTAPPANLAQAAPAPTPPGDRTPEPAQAVSAPPVPRGYYRATWAQCGHWADAPNRHDWDGHRHWCPVCDPGRLDDRCHGVRYGQTGPAEPAAVRVKPCTVCGDTTTAELYPGGTLCDRHSPWAQLGQPDPRLARPTPTRAGAA